MELLEERNLPGIAQWTPGGIAADDQTQSDKGRRGRQLGKAGPRRETAFKATDAGLGYAEGASQ